ncbi:kinase-like protein [Backusella circina FSU 941]|nr:kinase-like protein [Backusella circina FSU 941]
MPPNTVIQSPIETNHDDNSLLEATPYFDMEVPHSSLFEGAYKLVSLVFPTWKKDDIKLVQCKDGITNQLVKVTYQPTDFSVLVRAYGKGSELIIDRKQEITNIITLSSQNLCPPLYARFKNGLMYGYIKGRVSTVEDMARPKEAEWIAKRLALWHKVSLPEKQKEQKLWSTMFKWLEQIPEKYDDPTTQSIFETNFDKQKITAELHYLISKLEKIDSPIVFSHNDLLYGNVILDDDKQEANFIDYEYGCYAFRGFDIGNHFNEFAGFECEYDRYPTQDFQMEWFDWYLTENTGVKATLEQKQHLFKEVNGFSLASHFYWGLWAMVQAMVSNIDFDYMSYAVLRFNEYEKRKKEVF